MKSFFSLITAALLSFSCSTLLIKEEVPKGFEETAHNTGSTILTKATIGDEQNAILEECSKMQSNRIAILLNHVVYKDGVFVQSLTEKDMCSLGIKEEESTIAYDYLKALNQTKHEKEY